MPVLGEGSGARGQAGSHAGRGCRSLTCLSLPAEVGGSGHSTGAQSWPRAAAHGARTPAGPCGSRGVCLPHMPLGKLGLSRRVGWGEGAGPSGHREGMEPPWGGSGWGEAAGTLRNPPLPWTPNSNHGPQAFLFASTGQFRAQALLRESSGLSIP